MLSDNELLLRKNTVTEKTREAAWKLFTDAADWGSSQEDVQAREHLYRLYRDEALDAGMQWYVVPSGPDGWNNEENRELEIDEYLASEGYDDIDDFLGDHLDRFLFWWNDKLKADPDFSSAFWGRGRAEDGVLYFASGTNHEGEIVGMMRAGYNVGVAVPKIGPKAIQSLKTLDGATAVFVDSGAFSEVDFPADAPPVIAREITPAQWIKRLKIYADLAEYLGNRLFVVAPDCVAHQRETLERLERYATHVRSVARAGLHEWDAPHLQTANVIIPVQKGALPMAEFWRREVEILGPGINWIAGIPMRKDATSVAELEKFVRESGVRRIHLLGLGPESPRFADAIAAIRRQRPDCTITCDSVLLRRLSGLTNGPGGGPRAMTKRRYELLSAGWSENNAAKLKEMMVATALLDRDAGKRSILGAWALNEFRNKE